MNKSWYHQDIGFDHISPLLFRNTIMYSAKINYTASNPEQVTGKANLSSVHMKKTIPQRGLGEKTKVRRR